MMSSGQSRPQTTCSIENAARIQLRDLSNDAAHEGSCATQQEANKKTEAPPKGDNDGQSLTVNQRLEDPKYKLSEIKLVPRSYQTELYLQAQEKNVIIHLGTGLGKTYIIVLYLNDPLICYQIREKKLHVIFMAPTQDLVKQQAEYINKQVPHRVKVYCGRTSHSGLHIDHWNKEIWDQELKKIDILFMTPQIFASAIGTSLISWSEICATIFDECHHGARKKQKETGSPYTQILKHYRLRYVDRLVSEGNAPKPRIIGLTASLINNMPKGRDDIDTEIDLLEKDFSARCITDLIAEESKPKIIIHSHNKSRMAEKEVSHPILDMLISFKKSSDDVIKASEARRLLAEKRMFLSPSEEKTISYSKRLQAAAMGFSIKPTSFPKVFDALALVLRKCGLWTMSGLCRKLIKALEKPCISSSVPAETRAIYADFKEVLKQIENGLSLYMQQVENSGLLCGRPQTMALLEILQKEYERSNNSQEKTFSCIIFVRSRVEVVSLNEWIRAVSASLPQFKFIKCDYALGLAATQASTYACITQRKAIDQSRMLNDFRNNELNVVVTTSVLEEGIDLPVCSTVIRYDFPRTFREFVQSRGRARQSVSTFVALCDDASDTEEKLDKFNDFEVTLRERLKTRGTDIGPLIRGARHDKGVAHQLNIDENEEDSYTADGGRILIAGSTAKIILNMYITSMARFSPFTEGIRYSRDKFGLNRHQTTLYLPSCCPLSSKGGIMGNIKRSEDYADDSAAVATIKVLHEAGELDENVVPIKRVEKNIFRVLEKADLAPIYEDLPKELAGELVVEGKKEIFFYKPKLYGNQNYISKNFRERVYKMFRVTFIPNEQTRRETRDYFKTPVYGMIVDSSVSEEFAPKLIFSHYGQMQVKLELISDNLSITLAENHAGYLNYTYKLLTSCLSIKGFTKEQFKYHCVFYILPLDPRTNRPDLLKMERSFVSSFHKLRVGDVVKMNARYNIDPRSKNNDRLFVVRRIRNDLDATSRASGRSNRTFLDEAEYKYGRGVVRNVRQPIIEVFAVANQFARIKEGKKIKQDYSSSTLFYLDQFLELFDEDASATFQAFNFPEIIYRLYLYNLVADVDKQFLKETEIRREDGIRTKSSTAPQELCIEDSDSLKEAEHVQRPEELYKKEALKESGAPVEAERNAEVDGEEEELLFSGDDDGGSEDDDDDVESVNSLQSSDQDNDDERLLSIEESEELSRRARDYRRCETRDYRVSDLRRLSYERQSTIDMEVDFNKEVSSPIFEETVRNTTTIFDSMLKKLEDFRHKLTTDGYWEGEKDEFSKRVAKVDISIEPPIKLDRNTMPVEQVSRERGLLEALTLCRAQESYNLESLENLGDSFLKYFSSVILFSKLEGHEGILTNARSALTSNKHFTQLAKKRGLGSYAITSPFSPQALLHILGHHVGPNDRSKMFNRLRRKDLADTFESIIGSYLIHHSEFEAILATEWLGLKLIKEETFTELHSGAVVFSRAPSPLFKNIEQKFYQQHKSKVAPFEQILGYTFNDPSFLLQALTHASSTNKCTPSYERLEFLGDAILDYLVTRTLEFALESKFTPGQMTTSRSSLVNNSAFAKLAMRYNYDLFILHSNQSIYDELSRVQVALEEDPEMTFLDMTDFDSIVKLLGDVFESVAAAIYLDSGCSLDTVWGVYYAMMKANIDEEIKNPSKNHTSLLYETFPGKVSFEKFDLPTSEDNIIGVRCIVEGYGTFEGKGLSKRQAKQRAVCEALKDAPAPSARRPPQRRSRPNDNNQPRNFYSYRRNPNSGNYNRTGNNQRQRRF